jgi:hypothetical protein
MIRQKGKAHARDACELAFASRNQLKRSTSRAFARITQLRDELQIKPFAQPERGGNTLRHLTPCHKYSVYVVLLKQEVADENKSILDLNPERILELPCIYVGMTKWSPEERFRNHKLGAKASKYVRKHGLVLMPRLYAHLNPMTWREADQMEQQLALELREKGYTVIAGHQNWR